MFSLIQQTYITAIDWNMHLNALDPTFVMWSLTCFLGYTLQGSHTTWDNGVGSNSVFLWSTFTTSFHKHNCICHRWLNYIHVFWHALDASLMAWEGDLCTRWTNMYDRWKCHCIFHKLGSYYYSFINLAIHSVTRTWTRIYLYRLSVWTLALFGVLWVLRRPENRTWRMPCT